MAFAACAAAPGLARAQETDGDPWEGFNRDMYAVHESVDRAVLEPVARGYRAVTPAPIRRGVLNFLRNLRGPVIFANDLLQGEFDRAGVTAARFGVNTTVGFAGLLDPATSMGLERHDEDFGQTLAVWGVDSGPYLFLPLFGPTTVRDSAGRIVDMAFDPLTWAQGDDVSSWRAARTVTAGVAAREQALDAVDAVRRDSFDPYVTIRTSYGLLRDGAIANGPADVQDLPDFDDIDGPPAADETPTSDESAQQIEAIPSRDSKAALESAHAAPTFAPKSGENK
jgi:phospholipid-binding lipoprotein MlaA